MPDLVRPAMKRTRANLLNVASYFIGQMRVMEQLRSARTSIPEEWLRGPAKISSSPCDVFLTGVGRLFLSLVFQHIVRFYGGALSYTLLSFVKTDCFNQRHCPIY